MPYKKWPLEGLAASMLKGQRLIFCVARAYLVTVQVEGINGIVLYEKLIFSNIDDSSMSLLDTIVKKVR